MSDHIRALVTRPLSHSKVTCDTILFTREIKSSLVKISVRSNVCCRANSGEKIDAQAQLRAGSSCTARQEHCVP